MKNITTLGICIGILFLSISYKSFGQTNKVTGFPNDKLTTGTLDSQFTQLLNISKTMDQHKLIRRANLEQVRKNVADSLSHYQKTLLTIQTQAKENAEQVAKMQDSLQVLNETVQIHQNSQNSINFFGADLNKGFFKALFMSTTILLLIVILILIMRLKSNRSNASESKLRVDEIQEAFDLHRKKALEKEQKLMRQLQDEINKKGGY